MRENKRFDMELFFQALADKTRLRLIHLMGEDELCVCFLVEVLGTNQPKISRHLAYLRRAASRADSRCAQVCKPRRPKVDEKDGDQHQAQPGQ